MGCGSLLLLYPIVVVTSPHPDEAGITKAETDVSEAVTHVDHVFVTQSELNTETQMEIMKPTLPGELPS